ncbi:TonB-dependent receptor, partial [Brevundimonas sp.]|uniref:TonB-dependent receptor n=1 Tax=Brevundimonas sp. TaxID=1871086 RepID=UPI003A946A4B
AIDDVIVTAQRREQAAQDVGIALSVIGGEQLDEKNINVVNDLENAVPNMEVDSQFGSGQPQFRIRGIGAREYSSNNASTVGVYVDEVAHPYTVTTQGALFDVARLEVLRGPQGTLYGRNTTGGAVNIITNAPTRELSAGVVAEYGTFDRFKIEGFVSGPLSDNLRVRLAAITDQGGAWQYNRDTGEALGDVDKTAIRGRLVWDINDNVNINLNATYARDQSDGLGFRLLSSYPAIGGPVYPPDTEWRITGWRISPALAAAAGVPLSAKPFRDNEGFDLNAIVRADLGPVNLTSISAYQTFDRKEYNDWDSTRFYESDVLFYNTIKVLSQELRLDSNNEGPFQWMVGAHYANESNEGGFFTQFRGLAPLIETAYDQSVEAIGVFSNGSYELSERLRLVGGLRYEYEERSLTSVGTQLLTGGAVPPPVTYTTDLSEVSGRFGMEYDLSDDALFYANVARGVKSGGFTTYNATSSTPFRPEIVWAYEAGAKTELFDRRIRLNGAVFYYDYRDQQVQGLEYDRDNGRLGKITNVPESHIYGGEVEFTWVVVPGLELSQNVGYKRGKYDVFNAIDGPATDAANPVNGPWDVIITNDLSDQRLGFPTLTYGGAVSYNWAVGDLEFRAETNYSYRSDLYSVSANSIIPAYWLANASLSVGPSSADWTVTLWSRNIFDQYFEESRNGFNSSSRRTASPHQPRTVGVRLNLKY